MYIIRTNETVFYTIKKFSLESETSKVSLGKFPTLYEHACKTSAHAQGLYFQIGGCECELHNKNACFWAEIELY